MATVAVVFLLVWGLGTILPERNPTADQNGVGGPAEQPITEVLMSHPNLDLTRPGSSERLAMAEQVGWLAGAFIRSNPGEVRPIPELGPIGRTDTGPAAMRIGRGQTFYEALAARGVPHTDIMALVAACKSFRNLRTVRAGEVFNIHLDPDGGLRSLSFDLDIESYVVWSREGDTFLRQDGTYPVERRLQGIGGEISQSLYASLQELDAPLALAAKMNDILGWDLDFSRDLRKGDTFRILYEEIWKEGEFVRTGAVLAVEIVNRGKQKRAFRFSRPDGRPGFYDPDGNNMQKQLLRAPVEYSRISSGFSHRRFHPVLKRWMPHLGIDYAAPLGTPVRAGGDGVVVAATTKKGNGRYLHVRHTNHEYETYYLHLSRYAKGVKRGTKVSQGQIVGYVGATGYATGPHLDYRVKRNGVFVNPRKLKLPAAAPVQDNLRSSFASLSGAYAMTLDELPIGESVPVSPIAVIEPPGWHGPDYVSASLPETIRAAGL